GHHPACIATEQCGPRGDGEPSPPRADVLSLLDVPDADVGEQAGEERGVYLLRLGRLLVANQPKRAGHLPELALQVLPLADAEVVEEVRAAQLAELVGGELALLGVQVVPEVEQRDEVRVGILEPRVLLRGRLAVVVWSFPGVLN